MSCGADSPYAGDTGGVRFGGQAGRIARPASVRSARSAAWLLVALLLLLPSRAAAQSAASRLPARLSDAEFWRIVEEFSEPGGFFRSDNLVSNEDTYQAVLPKLVATTRRGGAFLGVGPDQNFTYIAALDPAVAFIVDIRRANLHLHLMYKAIFELSPDRAAFLSRLFGRPLPAGIDSRATAGQLFAALASARPDRACLERTRAAVIDRLRASRQLPLRDADAAGIAAILEAFFDAGPEISYSNTASGWGQYPTFRDLQIAADDDGVARGYLASEANYRRVRSLQQRNLIVPVVGDFAGPKALRAIGAWIASCGALVEAFYTSNVEQYLFENGAWGRFAETVAALPIGPSSAFVRSCFNSFCATSEASRSAVQVDPIAALLEEHQAGRITSYSDVLAYRRPTVR